MDEQGDKAAEEIATRLGYRRCRVKMPRKDGNKCLVDGVPESHDVTRRSRRPEWFNVARPAAPAEQYADPGHPRLFWPAEGDHVGYRTPIRRWATRCAFSPPNSASGRAMPGPGNRRSWAMRDRLDPAGEPGLHLESGDEARADPEAHDEAGRQHRPAADAMVRATLTGCPRGCCSTTRRASSKIEDLRTRFDYARSRYGCDQFIVDSLMRWALPATTTTRRRR